MNPPHPHRSALPGQASDHRASGRSRWRRYVALGDSFAEGLDDPDGNGGFHGWADRLAAQLAFGEDGVRYANLAIRGRRTRRILDEQLAPAIALKPDLVTLSCGTNDVVARRFDLETVATDIERLHAEIAATGATLVAFTLPDLSPIMLLGRLVAPRVRALNEAIREISRRSGARLLDFDPYPIVGDPRMWSADRLHANSAGHRRIAGAIAHLLDLPDSNESWAEPLPEVAAPSAARRLALEARWASDYLIPWWWRHLRGRSSGDSVVAKRATLETVKGTPLEALVGAEGNRDAQLA